VRPAVTVVVPSRDRPGRLTGLLRSLEAQTLGRDRFEVIVVDDASGDATPSVCERERSRGQLDLRVIVQPERTGPAAARNTGWRAARAPYIAFTDDDCTADGRWLEALLAAHEREPQAVVQGRTLPNPAEAALTSAFSHSIEITAPTPRFETCNIAYPRALLERLDGFDDRFGLLGGEDMDLGWRATESGAPHGFCEGALVYHAVEVPGALGLARRARRWEGHARVVAAHPELRDSLAFRVFWHRSHARLLLAASGALLARPTRGLALALLLPYVVSYRGVHGSAAGTVASLPAHVLVDAAELRAIASGAIRARTLLL
jgi:glycosyltransferase involved in cell wall biosynthesis